MRATTAARFWRVPFDAAEIPRTRGVLHILEERCKGCGYCAEFCPREVLELSARYNIKGYHPPDVRQPEACTACRLCELICPDFAISVEEVTYREVAHAH